MKPVCIALIIWLACPNGFAQKRAMHQIRISPQIVLNHIANKPIGINMNYFMDDDHYLKPKITTADALKRMGVKYLRYPGGNKADFYFFSKPPYQKSIPTLARTGRGAVGGRFKTLNDSCTDFKQDPLDFDEFIKLCRYVGAEPVMVVAADEYLKPYPAGSSWASRDQLINHAKEWVRYANITKKYGIKYWMIGNESWHESNPNSTATIYANDVIDFSKAMKAVDKSVTIIPNGNNKLWWDTLFSKAGAHFDAICISNYPIHNYTNGFKTYADTIDNLMGGVEQAKNAIAKFVMPSKQKAFKVVVAEYGPFDWTKKWPHTNNMGLAMANFEIIGAQLLEPKIDFSCFWNTRWMHNDTTTDGYDALDRNGNLSAMGISINIWANNLGTKMIKTNIISSKYLRTFASTDAKKQQLILYVINKSDKAIDISPDFDSNKKYKLIGQYALLAKNDKDMRPVWTKIMIKNKNKTQAANSIKVEGISINVLTYTTKK